MALDKTIAAPNRQHESSDEAGGAGEPAESLLLQQAKGYAGVARDAVEDCDRKEDPVTQLHKRRNGPGQ